MKFILGGLATEKVADDAGTEGLKAGSSFVVPGDQNAGDPLGGDSTSNAIQRQLIVH